jgi:hypothetical protein
VLTKPQSSDIIITEREKERTKMKRTIYFDMDGTIADFYGVNGWLKYLEKSQTKPYRTARPIFASYKTDFFALIEKLQKKGYKIGVISWSSKCGTADFHNRIRKAKLGWLAKNFPFAEEIHIIPYGTDKKSVALDKDGYLVDDEDKNLENWGKNAIPAWEMVNYLEKLANGKEF